MIEVYYNAIVTTDTKYAMVSGVSNSNIIAETGLCVSKVTADCTFGKASSSARSEGREERG